MKRHIRRPTRAQSCDGKSKLTRESAEAGARRVADTTGALMNAYRCLYGCKLANGQSAWHIGHQFSSR